MAPESANDMAIVDTSGTSSDISSQGTAFFFYSEDGGESSLWWEYPDGAVNTEDILNAYLREAGCEIGCVSVIRETEGEKDEIRDIGGEYVIEHTVGITTVTVTLDGIPREHVLRGLDETVHRMSLGNVKTVIILAEGEEIWRGEW